MSEDTRPSLDALLACIDTLEASAFRWGSLAADPATPVEAWEEGLTILRQARHSLRRQAALVWALGMAGGRMSPIDNRIQHIDCLLAYTDVEGISVCREHGAYVLTAGSPAEPSV
jgi:hypothetical protein